MYRARIGLHYHKHFKVKGIKHFTSFEFLVMLSIILLRCGDVHPNPGPLYTGSNSSDEHSSSDSSINDSTLRYYDLIQEKFSVVHYNVHSLQHKVSLLESELSSFQVLCFTETWLNNSITDDSIHMSDYKPPFRRDRQDDSHGGICVYVKENLFAKRRNDLEPQDIECVWIEISLNRKKMLIGTFYRPPTSPASTLTSIETSIGLACDTNISDILIVGDFNLDVLKRASGNKINSICYQFNLYNLIEEPTHFFADSSSCIDLILTSNKNSILLSGVGDPFLEQNIKYHCPVFCIFEFCKNVPKTFTRHIWLYDKGNFNGLRNALSQTDWETIKHPNIDTYAKQFSEHILNTAKKFIPNKNVTIRETDPPWLTSKIKKMKRKRKRLYDKYMQLRTETNHDNYKMYRNKVTNEIRKSKKSVTDKISSKLRDTNLQPKDYWRTLKQFIKPQQRSSIPPLNADGIILDDDTDKANFLNDYFTQQTSLDDTHASLPATPLENNSTLNSILITRGEVQEILKYLKVGKAVGPDTISNKLLKELSTPLSSPLCDLFNFSLRRGQFPNSWKEANITPIHKKDDPSDVSNYRPISLLNTIGKVFEKIVHKHVFNFFRDNNILTSLQSGFLPGDSTVNQLVDLYNTFCKALDDGKEVRAIFCDISKAFDRVWHRGLLYKLRRAGITGSLLSWFSNYLQDRKQRVVLPGASSNWSTVQAGVPQGSILGPLLFLLYINDIVVDIQSSIRLFADDTSLYIIVDDPLGAAVTLNSDLSKIHRWASQWLVKFNPSKSESLLFSRKVNKLYHPPVTMNYQEVTEVTSHKHLGIYFSNQCTWHEHIEYVKKKAWQRIYIMRRCKFQLDRKSLQTIYFSFIRPLLEYADVVWNNCTQYEAEDLELIQNEAARIVTGATRLASVESLLTETGWESLSDRRRKHKLIMFYKMKNSLCPEYLSSLIPTSVGSSVGYSLRNANDIKTIKANSELYHKSFLPSTIREWNDLPRTVRDSPSLANFKHQLNSNLIAPPAYYLTGNRSDQINHTRIRTRSSALNQHLFARNIVPSNLCACGGIESSRHYLLECNLYQAIRIDMLATISTICIPSIDILIYGSPDVSINDNTVIFKAVQRFISKSKRFC